METVARRAVRILIVFSLVGVSLIMASPLRESRTKACNKPPQEACPGRSHLCFSRFQEVEWIFKATLRQTVVVYDQCLSDTYGGVPLINRKLLNESLAESEIANIFAFPDWFAAFQKTEVANELIVQAWDNQTTFHEITKMSQLDELYTFFMEHYGEDLPIKPHGLWEDDVATNPRLTSDQRWNDDDVFAQLRLMGTNPVQLERVFAENLPDTPGMRLKTLRRMLNKTFDWNDAVRRVVNGSSLKKAAQQGKLFVLHFPLFAKVQADPDAMGAYRGQRMMAPIALFVSTVNQSSPLKPVAIQLGTCPFSPVYTPRSGYFWWTVAKMYVNNADGLVSQIVHHLVNSHLVSEVMAAAAFRHMQDSHPIHMLLRPHFQGLVGINTQGFNLLTSPNGAITQVAGFGHSGLLQLVELAYKDWNFDKMSFTKNLQKRGFSIDGSTDQGLSYYPYRDDGILVHRVLASYIDEYVQHYYCRDEDVQNDRQLQKWAAEVSKKHQGKGFPEEIESMTELKDVLLSIIWTNAIHHAVVNYPVKEFGSHLPTIAYSLYKRPSDWMPSEYDNLTRNHNNNLVAMLPPYDIAKTQAATASQLSALRFSDLLDYGHQMSDPFARSLAAKYFSKLRNRNGESVQTKIEIRNRKRQTLGQLAYRYMQPKFLPNSIAI